MLFTTLYIIIVSVRMSWNVEKLFLVYFKTIFNLFFNLKN